MPLGIATAVLLWVVLGAKERAPDSSWVSASRSASAFSYSLYLVHTPFLVLMAGLLCGETRWTPNLRHMSIALLILAVAVGGAFFFAKVTEANTHRIRRWLSDVLPGRASV